MRRSLGNRHLWLLGLHKPPRRSRRTGPARLCIRAAGVADAGRIVVACGGDRGREGGFAIWRVGAVLVDEPRKLLLHRDCVVRAGQCSRATTLVGAIRDATSPSE